ncbi:MAG: UDP-N-acetylmuramate--L-alanine ligase, partial [Prosthecobacter sp.]|nr:UDP-N-acetylmuramate--L-alanine ligase [Prosthecobacter sp.]
FTGIGGSGMSGIAEILLNIGFRVSGSDLVFGAVCERLQKLGAVIAIGHSAGNLPESTSLLVYSSAVSQDNPELEEARRRELPLVPRAEVLAELMRLKFGIAVAGSHGKTTTTSMIAAILEAGALDPTVVIGGQVQALGTGGKLGRGDFLVAESDESDRSFLRLKPTIAIVTNIDSEHLTAYESLKDLEESFERFVKAVPFYGLAVLCIDDPRVRDLAASYALRKVTYGFSPGAMIQAASVFQKGARTSYDVLLDGEKITHIDLPMPGKHLALNSLGAIAVGLELDIPLSTITRALNGFAGVGRRLEVLGVARGVTVVNDYGHHPTEVKATIEALRAGWCTQGGRLHVVFQPHRYTRTRDCFADYITAFVGCDNLVMTAIYAASEAPIEGISGELLCEAVSHPHKRYVERPEDVLPGILKDVESGDVLLCLGAGSIGALAAKVLGALKSDEQ